MKYDEFSFLNQQLAGMLKSGIPLERALREICSSLRDKKWRAEFEALEKDLANGVPLKQAITTRKLPDFYKQMVHVGIESNDLPTVLTLLADYYQKINLLWTRLEGLMVYPVLVLAVSFALSVFLVNISGALTNAYSFATNSFYLHDSEETPKVKNHSASVAGLFMPMLLLGSGCGAAVLLLLVPRWRKRACWILPGFKEAHLSRFASSLSLLLKSGCNTNNAIGLLQNLEKESPLGHELALWQTKLANGCSKFSELGAQSKIIPPLFFWMVAGENENWDTGLARAAEIYYGRALYRTELLLNAALPVSIIVLGLVILVQLISLVQWVFGGGDFDILQMLREMI